MPEVEDIIQRVCRIGALESVGADQVIYEAGFSSIDVLDLLVDLETAYGVTISDEQFMQATTPREMCTLIGALRAHASG